MYMVGIEDREYKEDKVECKFNFSTIEKLIYYSSQGGRMFMDITWVV